MAYFYSVALADGKDFRKKARRLAILYSAEGSDVIGQGEAIERAMDAEIARLEAHPDCPNNT